MDQGRKKASNAQGDNDNESDNDNNTTSALFIVAYSK
jgi:hypothetical protein